MTLTFKHSAPRWISVTGDLAHAAELETKVRLSDLDALPGVRFTPASDLPGSWARVEVPHNVLGTSAWRSAFGDLGGAPALRRIAPAMDQGQLYPHQRLAVDFLTSHRGGLLCDQMGLGKTRSGAVAATELAGSAPVLILGPLFTRAVWKRELEALGLVGPDGEGWCAIDSKAPDALWAPLRQSRFWFCHYELASEWAGRWVGGALPRPGAIILDEAHWLRNPKSLRAKAAVACAGPISQRILLTGTPVANRPRELWQLLTLLDGSYSWGSFGAFRLRYCGAESNGYGLTDTEPTHVEELRERMAGRYLRRTIDEAGLWMPPITRARHSVAARDPQAHAIAQTDLRRILDALERGAYSTDTLAMMQQLQKATSKAKRQATLELVTGLLAQDESVVIFVHERETAEWLALHTRCEGPATSWFVHGGQGREDREATIERFQATALPTALFATYGALREGVTLHRARHVVLHDFSWVPGDVLQAEARVYRIGQKRAVTSTWPVLEHSFDVLLASHLARKAQMISESVGDASAREAFAGVGLGDVALSPEDEAERLLAAWRTGR